MPRLTLAYWANPPPLAPLPLLLFSLCCSCPELTGQTVNFPEVDFSSAAILTVVPRPPVHRGSSPGMPDFNAWRAGWHRPCLKGRLWSTCLSGTAGLTGSGGSSSASAERKRSSSRSEPNGPTGTFYTCIGVIPTWGGYLRDCWSPFLRIERTCLNLRWSKVGNGRN